MKRMLLNVAVLGLCAESLIVQSATAQPSDFAPLSAILASDHEATYPLIRCAAFWTANIERAGQAIDRKTCDRAAKSVGDLVVVAVQIRAEMGSNDIPHFEDMATRDVRAISDLYLVQYRESYALRGAAWDGNALWQQDSETREPIALAAARVSESVGEEQ